LSDSPLCGTFHLAADAAGEIMGKASRNKGSRPADAGSAKGLSQRSGFILGIIAGIAVLALVFYAARRPQPTQATVTPAAPAAAPAAATAADNHDHDHAELDQVERITAADLKKLLDDGKAVTIDVRNVEGFVAGHIPGALQIPLDYVAGEAQYFPKDKRLITYCT
jgi:hypothetical protein